MDLDATLINVHSQKELAAPTFTPGFGYHPLCAFLDDGSDGTGEPLAIQLRAGNAGPNRPYEQQHPHPRGWNPAARNGHCDTTSRPDARITA